MHLQNKNVLLAQMLTIAMLASVSDQEDEC